MGAMVVGFTTGGANAFNCRGRYVRDEVNVCRCTWVRVGACGPTHAQQGASSDVCAWVQHIPRSRDPT